MLRRPFSIGQMLLVAFLFVGLLPATVITGMAFFAARDALETEIERDLDTRAAATVAEIDRMMFERLHNVASWSQLEVMQELRIGDVDKRLSRFLAELKRSYRGIYAELHVVDAAHVIVASSEPARLGQPLAAASGSWRADFGDTVVDVLPLVNGRLPLADDIQDSVLGTRAGTLYALFDWQQINAVLASATADGSAAALFDRRNRLIAATPHWHTHANQAHISARARSRGYQDIASPGWTLELAQPKTIALAPVKKIGWTFLLLLLSTIAVAALIALPVAASIARPLARLTEFARHFIQQQRGLPDIAAGPAEVRELAGAFRQMIQDLEQLKENLTRAAKLAVVGEMAAAMTHEVRTPLGILRSSAQLLLREPALSADGREVCGFIISETERLGGLVTTLLDCARARPAELRPLDLSALAQHAVALLAAQAHKKGIALACQPAPEPAWAQCDAEQMTQVLLNLILNALQLLPAGGRIEVSTHVIRDAVLLEVADDGPGVPPELYDRIFDPFFTRRQGGIGLGLTVVRQLVAAHHGEIGVSRSHLGGALFRLRLPGIPGTPDHE